MTQELQFSGKKSKKPAKNLTLVQAVQKSKIDRVQQLIEAKANSNHRGVDGLSVLMMATHKAEQLPVLELLLASKADPNLLGENGGGALSQAIDKGNILAVRALLAAKADINEMNESGQPALIAAIGLRQPVLIKELLDAKADIQQKALYGSTALLTAVAEGDLTTTQLLLQAKAKVDEVDESLNSPLYYLAFSYQQSSPEIARELIKAGSAATLNHKNSDGATPLIAAAQQGILELVTILIEAGADFAATNLQGESALELAERYKHSEIVEYISKKRAAASSIEIARQPVSTPSRAKKKPQGTVQDTKLHQLVASKISHAEPAVIKPPASAEEDLLAAIKNTNITAVTKLLSGTINKNIQDKDGNSPLMIAIFKQQPVIAVQLLNAGAKFDLRNKKQQTALILAANFGYVDLVDKLVKAGARVDERDEEENTPLMLAAKKGHSAVIDRLLLAGADKNLVNHNQETAGMLADAHGFSALGKKLAIPTRVLFDKMPDKTSSVVAPYAGQTTAKVKFLRFREGKKTPVVSEPSHSRLQYGRKKDSRVAVNFLSPPIADSTKLSMTQAVRNHVSSAVIKKTTRVTASADSKTAPSSASDSLTSATDPVTVPASPITNSLLQPLANSTELAGTQAVINPAPSAVIEETTRVTALADSKTAPSSVSDSLATDASPVTAPASPVANSLLQPLANSTELLVTQAVISPVPSAVIEETTRVTALADSKIGPSSVSDSLAIDASPVTGPTSPVANSMLQPIVAGIEDDAKSTASSRISPTASEILETGIITMLADSKHPSPSPSAEDSLTFVPDASSLAALASPTVSHPTDRTEVSAALPPARDNKRKARRHRLSSANNVMQTQALSAPTRNSYPGFAQLTAPQESPALGPHGLRDSKERPIPDTASAQVSQQHLITEFNQGHLEYVGHQLAQDKTLINTQTAQGDSLLMLAVSSQLLSKVRFILGHTPKPNVNHQNQTGKTALMLAAEKGRETIISALLDSGADKNYRDQHGNTALIYAVIGGYITAVEKLLTVTSRGMAEGINAVNNNYDSCLMFAAKQTNQPIVETLLKAKATVTLKNQQGFTAVDIARFHQNFEIAALLQKEVDQIAQRPVVTQQTPNFGGHPLALNPSTTAMYQVPLNFFAAPRPNFIHNPVRQVIPPAELVARTGLFNTRAPAPFAMMPVRPAVVRTTAPSLPVVYIFPPR